MVDIVRLHHVELCVTDLERAKAFYRDLLGLFVTEETKEQVFLRAIEDHSHHCLVLTKADAPGVAHIAYRVAREEDLDALAETFSAQGLPMRWVAPGEERGQGRALRVQDPVGLPLEFFCAMDRAERMLQAFHLHRGARPQRIDHIHCFVSDLPRAYDWYTKTLGFRCSEVTVTPDDPPKLLAAWLFRKPNVHDVALTHRDGPRFHHVAFWVPDSKAILDFCDILGATGRASCIERYPGRHGLSNAFFLYLRDPDGIRVELYTGDYFTGDPDWEPIVWRSDDPRRATFWGVASPHSWFEDLVPVHHVVTGEPVAVQPKGEEGMWPWAACAR